MKVKKSTAEHGAAVAAAVQYSDMNERKIANTHFGIERRTIERRIPTTSQSVLCIFNEGFTILSAGSFVRWFAHLDDLKSTFCALATTARLSTHAIVNKAHTSE